MADLIFAGNIKEDQKYNRAHHFRRDNPRLGAPLTKSLHSFPPTTVRRFTLYLLSATSHSLSRFAYKHFRSYSNQTQGHESTFENAR